MLHTETLSEHNQALPQLKIGQHTAQLPIIQGGMGIGISMAPLAGAVAREGGIGTLSSVGLYALPIHKKLLQAEIAKSKSDGRSLSQVYEDVNLQCIKLEIKKAKEIAGGGPVFINIMVAAQGFRNQVLAACEAGVDGIVCGAGLPLNLPEITKDYPNVSLIPILSNVRGVKLIVENWIRKYNRLPDAIILEDPSRAGGHLGIGSLEELRNTDHTSNFILENAIPEVKKYLDEQGYAIPIIAAGGIVDLADMMRVMKLGASGVQMGTRFLASEESSANDQFKQAVLMSEESDIIQYMSSAGLPARALKQSKILETMEGIVAEKRECVRHCLQRCAYRDGNPLLAQMCIVKELIKSTEGGNGDGLWFVGKSAAKIHSIMTVKAIMDTFKNQG